MSAIRRWTGWIKAFGVRVARDQVAALAAALSYSFLFSLFPFLLFVSALLGFLHLPGLLSVLRGPLGRVLPGAIRQFVVKDFSPLIKRQSPVLLSVGMVGFLVGISGAVRQFINAINHAYEFPFPYRRSALELYAVSIVLGLLLTGGLVLSVVLSAVGLPFLARLILVFTGKSVALVLISGVRWLLVVGLSLLTLAALYAWAPDHPQPFRLGSPGGVVAFLGWIVMSVGFSIYAAHGTHYTQVYGTLGTVILLMLYLYLVGFLLLIGAEINAMKTPPTSSIVNQPSPEDESPPKTSSYG